MTANKFKIRDTLIRIQNQLRFDRGATWGIIIIIALAAFEIFNFSTTDFALSDVLGTQLEFAGIRWATILAVAFCGIDFAGIARIFTPEKGHTDPTEIYYLFGAWFLAAGFNAVLTWWGISIAMSNTMSLGTGTIISSTTMSNIVPVFIAIMVWLIRILIIGTFSLSGDRLFTTASSGTRPLNSISVPGTRQVAPSPLKSASGMYLNGDGYAPHRKAPNPPGSQPADQRNYQTVEYGTLPAATNDRSYR